MSTKPTPGPLIVRAGANGDVGVISTSQKVLGLDIGGAVVAEFFADIRHPNEGARAEALANATLFHAAGDLLEALVDVVPPMPPADAPCHVGLVPQYKCANCQRIARAHAAIVKATSGGQPDDSREATMT